MRRSVVMGVLIGLAIGCDSGPSGPGDLTGTVQTSNASVGGAVLEVVGGGIQSFSGAGGTKVFWAPQDDPRVFRLVVISPTGGELDFQVSVRDRGGRKPRATVVDLVDVDNLPVPVSKDDKVRFSN
jgi:hypothetical protein